MEGHATSRLQFFLYLYVLTQLTAARSFNSKNPKPGPVWQGFGQNLRKSYGSTTSRGVFRSLRFFFPVAMTVEPASLFVT